MQLNTMMKDEQTSLKSVVCLIGILYLREFNCGLVFSAVITQNVGLLCLHTVLSEKIKRRGNKETEKAH